MPETMRSNCDLCISSRASFAEGAIVTSAPQLASIVLSNSRVSGSSSTTRTLSPSIRSAASIWGRMDAFFDFLSLVDRYDGQLDGKSSTLSFSMAVGMNFAAVQFHEMPHDRKPETQTAVRTVQRRVPLAEPVEDERQKLLLYSYSCVRHDDFEVRVDSLQTDLNSTVFRRELDGVGKKIPNDLLKTLRISRYRSDAG